MPLYITEDRTGDYAARFPEARDAALKAAAQVYANEVKRALAPGYTSGAFVTGRVLNSVTVGAPHDGAIEIGSDLDYAMYWEMGHHNIFTRRFERVEIWRPSLDAMEPEMLDVFNGTMLSWLLQGPPE